MMKFEEKKGDKYCGEKKDTGKKFLLTGAAWT